MALEFAELLLVGERNAAIRGEIVTLMAEGSTKEYEYAVYSVHVDEPV